MKHTVIAAVIASALGLLVLTGCSPFVDPCTTLAPPTADELAAARGGAEVSRQLNPAVECDVINGQWAREE